MVTVDDSIKGRGRPKLTLKSNSAQGFRLTGRYETRCHRQIELKIRIYVANFN